jgi:hypothetical protein
MLIVRRSRPSRPCAAGGTNLAVTLVAMFMLILMVLQSSSVPPSWTRAIDGRCSRSQWFGELRSLLGENKVRKAARYYASGLSNHVTCDGQTWERRLGAEHEFETWKREKRDVVEVPELSQRARPQAA